ncbi:hypothetical protein CYLTODRAFT_419517 [Cylindrobasidium torrendii FP15055 ss-10]|uniref:Uncharacterized protein n=1 Tax=Cylindrobasidium torrendii FP15055 ss-10 TaxID=1314674 RepID=A0A0D7BJJ2_9AGAR|nr:hypothetical protein CYLTODRAFT_419517 [Cylindrobasidium torrendii FP15055 ss-10]
MTAHLTSPTQASSRLHMADVGSLLIKLGRVRNSAKAKAHQVSLSSGPSPISHDCNAANHSEREEPVQLKDTYVCHGGVNSKTLLRATRGSLLEAVEAAGANALVNEVWTLTISGPKYSRRKDSETFKVKITYSASAVHCAGSDDPHQPVALSNAKNIPGLMAISRRNDDYVRY